MLLTLTEFEREHRPGSVDMLETIAPNGKCRNPVLGTETPAVFHVCAILPFGLEVNGWLRSRLSITLFFFSSSILSCPKGGKCKAFPAPQNGYAYEKVDTHEYGDLHVEKLAAIVGTERKFGCENGFALYGPQQLFCQLNAIWSSQPPLCLSKWTIKRSWLGTHSVWTIPAHQSQVCIFARRFALKCLRRHQCQWSENSMYCYRERGLSRFYWHKTWKKLVPILHKLQMDRDKVESLLW